MANKKLRVLGISGSLRASSSNNKILKVIEQLMNDGAVDFIIYNGVGDLPHFDDSPVVPPAVEEFRNILAAVDAVLICTPEYAFGVPGSLKNALDWTVGTGDFVGKPVALITASSVGDKAHAALLHTLTAISADINDETNLLISFIRAKLNEKGEISDEPTYDAVKRVVQSLINKISL